MTIVPFQISELIRTQTRESEGDPAFLPGKEQSASPDIFCISSKAKKRQVLELVKIEVLERILRT